MHKRAMIGVLGLVVTFSLAADQKPLAFYFGGKPLSVGMSKSDAETVLSACCKVTPAIGSENENSSPGTSGMSGHFIWSKDDSQPHMLGSIFFVGRKIARITHPLDDNIIYDSDNLVAFARTLDRSFSQGPGDSSASTTVSTQHQRSSNADSEILSFSFPNGRTVQLEIITLDKPLTETGKRDSVSLTEVLDEPR